jgi:hypothetical protein
VKTVFIISPLFQTATTYFTVYTDSGKIAVQN